VPGKLRDPAHCRTIVAKAMEAFGPADMLVNNAAFQITWDSLETRPTRNGTARCRPTSPHVPSLQGGMQHMPAGSSIVNTDSINSDTPKPKLLAYKARKVAMVNFIDGLAQLLAETRRPRQFRGTWTDLDASDSRHHASRTG